MLASPTMFPRRTSSSGKISETAGCDEENSDAPPSSGSHFFARCHRPSAPVDFAARHSGSGSRPHRSRFRTSDRGNQLGHMDSNHDKENQNLLSCH